MTVYVKSICHRPQFLLLTSEALNRSLIFPRLSLRVLWKRAGYRTGSLARTDASALMVTRPSQVTLLLQPFPGK